MIWGGQLGQGERVGGTVDRFRVDDGGGGANEGGGWGG